MRNAITVETVAEAIEAPAGKPWSARVINDMWTLYQSEWYMWRTNPILAEDRETWTIEQRHTNRGQGRAILSPQTAKRARDPAAC